MTHVCSGGFREPVTILSLIARLGGNPASVLESERPGLEAQLCLHTSFVAQRANPRVRHLQSVDSFSLAGLSWRFSEMVPGKPLAHSPTQKRDFVRK